MLTKTRHNKKRNTAFLYEALVGELTKCIVTKDGERKGIIVSLVKEHFGKNTLLRKELDLYKALYETDDLDSHMGEKLIYEVKRSHQTLDREEIFKEQTILIDKINRMLSKNVFGNFVPNYKSLATISQILNPDVSVKHRVLLESTLIESLSVTTKEAGKMAPIDNLVYKTFVKKFNDQYGGKLLERQQHLLSTYIASFQDEGAELKVFLNEEIGRLKEVVTTYVSSPDAEGDHTLIQQGKRVMELLQSYNQKEIDEGAIKQILKIQNLVAELEG